MYVPSLELGLSHPFSRKRMCPPPGPKGGAGGAHSPAAKGVGKSQFQRLEKRLALCLLCGWITTTCCALAPVQGLNHTHKGLLKLKSFSAHQKKMSKDFHLLGKWTQRYKKYLLLHWPIAEDLTSTSTLIKYAHQDATYRILLREEEVDDWGILSILILTPKG